MADHNFITLWRFRAPLADVWDLIYRSEDWPSWWRGVERVEKIEPGDSEGVGGVQRYTWKSKLPYRLAFRMRLTRVEPMSLIEGEAIGALPGSGRWQLTQDGAATSVRSDWNAATTKPWVTLPAPAARPRVQWNHHALM